MGRESRFFHDAVPATSDQQPATRRRGAPPGNLNALRSGAYSKQLEALVRRALADPDFMLLIEAFGGSRRFRDPRVRDAIRTYAARIRRAQARDRRERPRRYEWLPYDDEAMSS